MPGRDLKQVKAVCSEFGMTAEQGWEFGRYIHQCKVSGMHGAGIRGDFTMNELRELAREFLNVDKQS
jgi:hypothetical protein